MYVTNAEIIAWLGSKRAEQLTVESGAVDTAMIDARLAEAEGEVQAAVDRRTSIAITEAVYPKSFAMLRGWVIVITVLLIAQRRPPVPTDWQKQYDRVMEQLKKLGDGEIGFPDLALNGTQAFSQANTAKAPGFRKL